VVDVLTKTYKSVPTIYFYCHYGESSRLETSALVRSMLQQLLKRCRDLDQKLVSAYENPDHLASDSSKLLLAETLSRFQKVFIVVDALDECSKEERRSMVELFTRQLQPKRCHVKVFLTIRLENDLDNLLRNNLHHRITVEDTSKDIKPFVTATVKKLIECGDLLPGQIVTPELKEYLIVTLNKKADGMYVLRCNQCIWC
jgi:hypothetical protein